MKLKFKYENLCNIRARSSPWRNGVHKLVHNIHSSNCIDHKTQQPKPQKSSTTLQNNKSRTTCPISRTAPHLRGFFIDKNVAYRSILRAECNDCNQLIWKLVFWFFPLELTEGWFDKDWKKLWTTSDFWWAWTFLFYFSLGQNPRTHTHTHATLFRYHCNSRKPESTLATPKKVQRQCSST